MEPVKIVARFKNGSLKKGTVRDFSAARPFFHLTPPDGTMERIDIETLKAVFFVKDLAGNKDYKETYADTITGAGRKIQVEFADGETIVGFSQGYSPGRPGFFVIPADRQSNNIRIFVITSAAKRVSFP